MRTSLQRRAFPSFGLAVASVCAAMLLTGALRGVGDSGISPLFFAAVLLSAWYGGLGPGLLATVLSGIATAYLLVREHGATFASIRDHILRLFVFTFVALITSSLHAAMRRAAETSKRAKEAAEAASEAKSRFLAMVSHELRTPLSPVVLITELLEKDPSLTPSVRADIRTIRKHVDLEIRLIDDLVDLTRITAGKMQLHEAPLDLYEPLNAAIEFCRDDVLDKQLQLTTHFDARETRLIGDSVRLQQVFWNLIRNAVKFTPEGGSIRISVFNDGPAPSQLPLAPSPGTPGEGWGEGRFSSSRDKKALTLPSPGVPGEGKSWVPAPPRIKDAASVVVEISDTGIGIDPQQLSRIFEAFEQGEPDIQIRFGGLGLGLAICQALVVAHKGSIAAKSEGKGRGATFFVALPIVPSLAQKPAAEGADPRLAPSPMS